MTRPSSGPVLRGGFAIILAILAYSAVEAYDLQGAGDEQQELAYGHFIRQDDAITELRRTIWLGGTYSRDYFLNQNEPGRRRYAAQVEDLNATGLRALVTLGGGKPQADFREFIEELREMASPVAEGIQAPKLLVEEVLTPRRNTLFAILEELRGMVRQELADSQDRFHEDRKDAARKLVFLLGAAILLGALVAILSLRFASRSEAETTKAKQELENLSARLLEIQEQERRTLAQELHDEVGQTLTALRLELSQALPKIGESEPKERVARAKELAEKTVSIVRDISLMLRPSLLDDLGLGPALHWQLEQFSNRSGIRTTFVGAEVGEQLPDTMKTCIFRIAQEALNNCEKYSAATQVSVTLRHEEGQLALEVQDNGVGFALDRRGLPGRGTGILGMKERLQKLGGSLSIETAPGAGAKLVAALEVLQ